MNPSRRWILAAALTTLAPSILATLAALTIRSHQPRVLGLWSVSFFLLLVVNLGCLLSTIGSALAGRFRVASLSALPLLAFAYVAATNNQLRSLPLSSLLLAGARVGTGCWLVALAFLIWRAKPAAGRRWLAFGASLFALVVADLTGAALLRPAPERFVSRATASGVAPSYDESTIVIIGDSFAYGTGVSAEEAFPSRLQGHLGGLGLKVVNLGEPGTGLDHYLAKLRLLPRHRRTVVCFFLNDMPPRETVSEKLRQALIETGRGSLLARLAADLVGVSRWRHVDDYEADLIRDYDPAHRTYRERWAVVTYHFGELVRESRTRTTETPILVLLPMLRDYSGPTLEEAHRDLERAGAAAGFQVLDLLPVFRDRVGNGIPHRVAPNDGHYDAACHEIVAESLAKYLDAR